MTELWNFRCNFNIRSAYQGFLHETATSYWGLLSFLASGDSGNTMIDGKRVKLYHNEFITCLGRVVVIFSYFDIYPKSK